MLRFFPIFAKPPLFTLLYIQYCVLLRRRRWFENKRSHLSQHAISDFLTIYTKLIVFLFGGSGGSKKLRSKYTNFDVISEVKLPSFTKEEVNFRLKSENIPVHSGLRASCLVLFSCNSFVFE